MFPNTDAWLLDPLSATAQTCFVYLASAVALALLAVGPHSGPTEPGHVTVFLSVHAALHLILAAGLAIVAAYWSAVEAGGGVEETDSVEAGVTESVFRAFQFWIWSAWLLNWLLAAFAVAMVGPQLSYPGKSWGSASLLHYMGWFYLLWQAFLATTSLCNFLSVWSTKEWNDAQNALRRLATREVSEEGAPSEQGRRS